jgi:hypothetical protein
MRSTSLRVNRCSKLSAFRNIYWANFLIWPNFFGSRPRIGSNSPLGNSEVRPVAVQKFPAVQNMCRAKVLQRVAGRSGGLEKPRAADKERPAAFTQGVA